MQDADHFDSGLGNCVKDKEVFITCYVPHSNIAEFVVLKFSLLSEQWKLSKLLQTFFNGYKKRLGNVEVILGYIHETFFNVSQSRGRLKMRYVIAWCYFSIVSSLVL